MMTQPTRSGRSDADPASLVGRKVRLRAVEAADRRTLAGFDRASMRSHAAQLGGYRHWAAHRAGAADSEDNFQFAIEASRGGMLIGSISSVRIGAEEEADVLSDRFSYGVGVGARHRRCGYAGDAIITLLGFMFAQRGYRKCEVSIYGGNLASLSLHVGLGFREEARSRDTELSRGRANDLVLMGLTVDEFADLHPDFTADRPVRGRHWRNRRGRHWNHLR